MQRIKRVKGDRVHYAAAVERNGSVSGWSEDAARAVAVTDEMAGRVQEYHRHLKNVGTFSFEQVDVSPEVLAQAVTAEDGVRAEEFARLQADYKRLRESLDVLLGTHAKTEANLQAADRREKELVGTLTAMEEQLTQARAEAAQFKARAAELEKPKEPAKPEPPKQEPPKPEGKPSRK